MSIRVLPNYWSLGYNIAELPITDLGHALRVVKISRAIDQHLEDDRCRRKMYQLKKKVRL